MSITCLPIELLHRIVSHCETQSVPNIRLACHVLAVVGAEYLLPEATMFYARRSLESCEVLVQHSAVAKGVKGLCFAFNRLPSHSSFEEWNQHRSVPESRRGRCLSREDPLRHKDTSKSNISEAELRTAYECYRMLHADEGNLVSGGFLHSVLIALFKACPKLDSISLTMADSLRSTSAIRERMFKEAMAFPWSDANKDTYGAHALETTLRSAHEARRKLRALTIKPMSHSSCNFRREIAPKVNDVISELKDLRISCADKADWTSQEYWQELVEFARRVRTGHVLKFISSATQLRTLILELPCAFVSNCYTPLQYLVGNFTWPRLQTLHIECFECSQRELINLLMGHKATLERLSLMDAFLDEGDWVAAFRAVAGKLPSLHKIHLRGRLACQDRRRMFTLSDRDELHADRYTASLEAWVIKGGHLSIESGKRSDEERDHEGLGGAEAKYDAEWFWVAGLSDDE